ncbi:MAG TPA: peptidoglycan-binding protein LysM [Bacteroidales bacterium]|jgi:nucleoid-associated protein YgaU|nr:peptidoglycan-binding protein LysM [Bacteroidales bacterium]NLK55608.1 peptidoglycan-binding protein LysM [Bacteroidales bacterium]HNY51977.1 peptidoglycan-binding protein LysM [Bacteroidales bacterium]HOG56156.1 peptidoglycan-binding protein LysM [Bacteroidales bacterium]HPV15833.1 peptidoglycan-binding protein LysM [Bacteroidales bacterium]
MGLISFIKNAGDKIFKSEEKKEQEKADLILSHIRKFGFDTSDIKVKVDDDKVILMGSIDTIDNRNKVIVTAGNIEGIAKVDDWLVVKNPPAVAPPPPEKQYYTVKKGDYLSKIAKEVYGDAKKYNIIFEANKPMLKDPDLIYPGQVLVIPPLP